MTLSSGARLGPYEVISQIGAGGMGEVYVANDTNLKRAVAIKVLPASMASDVERLIRFQREAETLASLNHPNIAQIHGLENSAGVIGLVMELVEGPTLADRIAQGAIPIDEALPIARQIAEALEAAHERGIIHRDLKPANIKVRSDGTVKVLDFGLAKATDPASALSPSLSQSPTFTTPAMMTGVGMIIGTAAYMSPEQARGKAVDTRADIWAFGCVLYEMLTGKQAFGGETVSDILGGILKIDPDWNALPASTPWPLASLLRHCLQKDSRRRMQAIGDARFALEDMRNMATAARSAPVAPRPWVRVSLAGATLAMIGVLLAAAPWSREAPAPLDETRFSIALPAQTSDMAVSPDGRTVVFVSDSSGLWIRRLNSIDAVKLPGTEGAARPFWSPDSRSVGYLATGSLLRTEVGGGTPRVVSLATNTDSVGTWNSEGVILFTTGNVIRRVSALGGDSVPVTELDKSREEVYHRHPFFLPDGRHFVYSALSTVTANSSIRVGSIDSRDSRELIAAVSRAAYVKPGWLLFHRAGTLFAQSFDADRLELRDEPVRVTDDVAYNANGFAAFGVSDGGALVYRAGAVQTKSELAWFDRSGKRTGQAGAPATYTNLELSPDQARLAVDITDDQSGARDIWVVDLARPVTTRLTFNPGSDQRPVWSPDGNQIAFQAGGDLYLKRSNGTGNQELLLDEPSTAAITVPYSFTPDGRSLLVARAPAGAAVANLWLLTLQGDRKPSPLVRSPYWDTPGITFPSGSGEHDGQFSPDGKWVVYTSNESGKYEIYVESNPPGAGKWQVSTTGGMQPRWRRDGKEIFYIGADGKLMAVAINAAGATVNVQTPTALFQTQLNATTFVPGTSRQYDVSADGQRFLVNTPLSATSSLPINVILNWTAILKK